MNKKSCVLCRNFISIYKINRTLHGCLGIRILSSRAESISHSFASLTRERYFQHSKIKFVSLRSHVMTFSVCWHNMSHTPISSWRKCPNQRHSGCLPFTWANRSVNGMGKLGNKTQGLVNFTPDKALWVNSTFNCFPFLLDIKDEQIQNRNNKKKFTPLPDTISLFCNRSNFFLPVHFSIYCQLSLKWTPLASALIVYVIVDRETFSETR